MQSFSAEFRWTLRASSLLMRRLRRFWQATTRTSELRSSRNCWRNRRTDVDSRQCGSGDPTEAARKRQAASRQVHAVAGRTVQRQSRLGRDRLRASDDRCQSCSRASSLFSLVNSESFEPKPNLLTASTTKLFLGVQLGCAECHNHPFAEWKQTQFWNLAAFFGKSINARSRTSRCSMKLAIRHSVLRSRFPTGARRQAKWSRRCFSVVGNRRLRKRSRCASSLRGGRRRGTNPYFARAMANRLWLISSVAASSNHSTDFRMASRRRIPISGFTDCGIHRVGFRYSTSRSHNLPNAGLSPDKHAAAGKRA